MEAERQRARRNAAAVVSARRHAIHRRLGDRRRRCAPRRPRARARRLRRGCWRWRGTAAPNTCSTRRRSPSRSRAPRHSALANPGAPVLLIDHCDNCGSGGAQDVMDVVAEILNQELDDVAIAPIRDPAAVATMIDAGVGQTRQLEPGRPHRHALDRACAAQPLAVEGRVLAITDGEFMITGPMYTGVRTYLGRTAVLESTTRRARRSWSPNARTSRSTSACSRTRASIPRRNAT